MSAPGDGKPPLFSLEELGRPFAASLGMWSAWAEALSSLLVKRGAPAAETIFKQLAAFEPLAPQKSAPLPSEMLEELRVVLGLPVFADLPALDPAALPSAAPMMELAVVAQQYLIAIAAMWPRLIQRFQAELEELRRQGTTLDSAGRGMDLWNNVVDRTLQGSEIHRTVELHVRDPGRFPRGQDAEHLERGFMNVWTRNLSTADIDLLVDTMGNIPGEVGGAMFSLMTPFRSLAKYNPTLMEAGQDRAKLLNFLRMEKWLADRPAHSGEAARQWLKDLYQENKLVKGELMVGGRKVDPRAVRMPALNIYTETDHVIPAPASTAMHALVGTQDYTEAAVSGGHIGLFVSRNQEALRDQIVGWLEKR